MTNTAGCCSGCQGTGYSGDPDTNGKCWDCYATGCAHPKPLCELESFPTGIEQARRDFMRDHPILYDYIEARLVARTWDDAGDLAGGAGDNYEAANRCYGQHGRFLARATQMRDEYPNPKARS